MDDKSARRIGGTQGCGAIERRRYGSVLQRRAQPFTRLWPARSRRRLAGDFEGGLAAKFAPGLG